MLTILYPKEDYTAADVAIRVQALAAGEGHKIYIVPRHFGRDREQVEKNLAKTTAALLIACDQTALDETSRHDLALLAGKNIKIIGIVPDSFSNLPQGIQHYDYKLGDPKSFADTVQRFVTQLNQGLSGKKEKENSLLVIGGIMIASIILLSFLKKK